MERRIKASHPDFEEINKANQQLAILKNRHVHWNSRYVDKEPSQEDLLFTEGAIERHLDKLLDGGIARDFITTLDMEE